MKKIITLLFSLGAFATSFAQYDHRRDDQYANSSYDNRNYSRDDEKWGHFKRDNIFSQKEREFQIEKINLDFDFRVQAIKCDRYLRHREKKAAIRSAEIERSRQLQLINERFGYTYWHH